MTLFRPAHVDPLPFCSWCGGALLWDVDEEPAVRRCIWCNRTVGEQLALPLAQRRVNPKSLA